MDLVDGHIESCLGDLAEIESRSSAGGSRNDWKFSQASYVEKAEISLKEALRELLGAYRRDMMGHTVTVSSQTSQLFYKLDFHRNRLLVAGRRVLGMALTATLFEEVERTLYETQLCEVRSLLNSLEEMKEDDVWDNSSVIEICQSLHRLFDPWLCMAYFAAADHFSRLGGLYLMRQVMECDELSMSARKQAIWTCFYFQMGGRHKGRLLVDVGLLSVLVQLLSCKGLMLPATAVLCGMLQFPDAQESGIQKGMLSPLMDSLFQAEDQNVSNVLACLFLCAGNSCCVEYLLEANVPLSVLSCIYRYNSTDHIDVGYLGCLTLSMLWKQLSEKCWQRYSQLVCHHQIMIAGQVENPELPPSGKRRKLTDEDEDDCLAPSQLLPTGGEELRRRATCKPSEQLVQWMRHYGRPILQSISFWTEEHDYVQVRQFEVAHRSMWLTLQPLLALLFCRAEEVRIFGAFLLMALCQGLENRLLLLQEEERHFACLQLARFSRSPILAELSKEAMGKMWSHGVDPPSLVSICSFFISERYHKLFSGLLPLLPKPLHHLIVPFDHATEPWQHGMTL